MSALHARVNDCMNPQHLVSKLCPSDGYCSRSRVMTDRLCTAASRHPQIAEGLRVALNQVSTLRIYVTTVQQRECLYILTHPLNQLHSLCVPFQKTFQPFRKHIRSAVFFYEQSCDWQSSPARFRRVSAFLIAVCSGSAGSHVGDKILCWVNDLRSKWRK